MVKGKCSINLLTNRLMTVGLKALENWNVSKEFNYFQAKGGKYVLDLVLINI